MKPPQRGRTSIKSETSSETSPVEGRRGRSASNGSSVSSRESSLDGSKPVGRTGRTSRGRKVGEDPPSRSSSRTRNTDKDSQDLNTSGHSVSGRGSRSHGKEEETVVTKTKGKVKGPSKAAQVTSEEESLESETGAESGKVPRMSARKRTSEESQESLVPKKHKRGGKDPVESSPKTEESETRVPKRGSKRDGSVSKIEEVNLNPPSAKKSKREETIETVLVDNNSSSRRSRAQCKADSSAQKAESSDKGQGRKGKVEVKVEEPDSSVGTKKRKAGKADNSQSQVKDSTPSKKSRLSEVTSPKGKQKAAKTEVMSPSLRRKSVEPKPHVLFTGVVDEQGQKVVKDLGGNLATSIQDCTHLVTDKVRRTVKFLGCLARGVPIITTHWLSNSKSAGTFLDSSKFIVSDTAAEKQYKFSLKKSLALAGESNMLQGYKIHVTKSVRPEPAQMKDIIECAGGQYLPTMPKKCEANVMVLSCDEDKALCSSAIKSGIPVVSSEFILTGILRQEVDVDNFRLFVEDREGSKGNARSKSRR